VIVIGGGAIGLSAAWRLSSAGLTAIVVDPAPGTGASHVAAGMLAPVGEATFGERSLLELSLASWRLYPSFVAELEEATAMSTGYSRCGMLVVARDSDQNAALERDFRFRASLGLAVQRLTSSECRMLEPRLSPSVRGGVLVVGDAQVNPRRLSAALQRACADRGVEIVRERGAVLVERNRVVGVRLEDQRVFATPIVVLAAGCWSAQVEGVPREAVPPVRPVKGQILHLGGDSGSLVSRIVRVQGVYIVPRGDGRVVVGATVEERGFDTTVTAGAVYELLRDAHEVVPDIAELQLVSVTAGLRPGTPDNAPIVGESALAGLLIATGHYRNGILLTPITAEAIAARITLGSLPAEMQPFTPGRFARVAEVVQ
jgi:glycine oxidase